MMKYQDDHYYHVYNRGAHKAKIFFSDENYRYCLRLVRKHSRQNKVSIVAYCLMPNHYHFILKQLPGGSISKFLKATFSAYSQAVNVQQNHSGTLFQGKAKGKLIDSDEYALQIACYMHLNPVEAGLTPNPSGWEYSDYNVWIGASDNRLTDLSLRDGYFRNNDEYRLFVAEQQSEKYKERMAEFEFETE